MKKNLNLFLNVVNGLKTVISSDTSFGCFSAK